MDELRKASEAIQHAAHKFGVKALAAELDKAPSTLYDELSLSPGAKAKLGFDDALRIMVFTQDVKALRIAASKLGYALTPIEDPVPDRPTIEGECLDDYPSIQAAHTLIQDGEHPVTVEQQFEEHFRECRQTLAAYKAEWVKKSHR